MLNIPAKSEFPIGEPGASSATSQMTYLKQLKTDGCISCHQIGNIPTRDFAPGVNPTTWPRRGRTAWRSGPTAGRWVSSSDRSAGSAQRRCSRTGAGGSRRASTPFETPPRPQGAERNVVITQWDWADPREYFHDVDRERQAQPAHQSERPRLRAARELVGSPDDPRTEQERWGEVTIPTNPAAAMSPRGGGPRHRRTGATKSSGTPVVSGHSNEMDQKGACVEHHEHAHAERDARLLQGRVGQSIGEGVPDAGGARPSVHGLRSEDQEIRHRRHLLQHVPPELRHRCEQHDLERRRRTRRLGEHQDPGRDARRGQGPGLDGAHRRHERQRQA